MAKLVEEDLEVLGLEVLELKVGHVDGRLLVVGHRGLDKEKPRGARAGHPVEVEGPCCPLQARHAPCDEPWR